MYEMKKAQIMRELGDCDITLCEVLLNNIFRDLEPEEIAALVSVYENILKGKKYKRLGFANGKQKMTMWKKPKRLICRTISNLPCREQKKS